MLRHKRIWLLLALTAPVLLLRLLDIEEQAHYVNWRVAGIETTVKDGRLAVDKVVEKSPVTGEATPAFQAGIRPGDRIVAIYSSDGQGGNIRGRMDADWVERAISNQQPWTMVVERGGGAVPVENLRLAMAPLPRENVPWKYLAIRIAARDLVPLIALVTALLIGLAKPDDQNALIASLLLLGFTALFGFTTRPGVRDALIVLRTASLEFTPYLILRFFLLFPSPSPIERRAPWLKHVFLILVTATWLYDTVATLVFQESFAPLTFMGSYLVDPVLRNLLRLMLALGLLSLVLNIAALCMLTR